MGPLRLQHPAGMCLDDGSYIWWLIKLHVMEQLSVAGLRERLGQADATGEPQRWQLHEAGVLLPGTAQPNSGLQIDIPYPPWDFADLDATDHDAVLRRVAEHLQRPRLVIVALLRRGGCAAAVVQGNQVLASKVGKRYVQGSTAAGGWSQQRFARRRSNQADALVGKAADILQQTALPQLQCYHAQLATDGPWLVTGGDQLLLKQLLALPSLREIAQLPTGPAVAVGNPNAHFVQRLPYLLQRLTVR